jgi:hypothetical protein
MCFGALLTKLIGLFLVVPPLYLVARFVRWSLKQEKETKEVEVA